MSDELRQIVSEVAGREAPSPEKRESFIQLVVFQLDDEEYGVPITDLQEVVKTPEITPIPNAPEFIKGILNLRGRIVVAIDLEKRFGLVREKEVAPSHIVIAGFNGSLFGVLVDRVSEVLRIRSDSINPPPPVISSKINADYISGVAVIPVSSSGGDSRLLVIVDLKKMLQEKELLKVDESMRSIEGQE